MNAKSYFKNAICFIVIISSLFISCKNTVKAPHSCFLSTQKSLDSIAFVIEDSYFKIDSLEKITYAGELYEAYREQALEASNLLVYGCSQNPFLNKQIPLDSNLVQVYERLAKSDYHFKKYLLVLEENNYLFTASTKKARENIYLKEVWTEWDWEFPYVHPKTKLKGTSAKPSTLNDNEISKKQEGFDKQDKARLIKKELEDCIKNSGSSDEVFTCLLEYTKILDVELQKRYQIVFDGLAEEEFAELEVIEEVRKSLETWMEFRTKELFFISHYLFIKNNENSQFLLTNRTFEITQFKTPYGDFNPKYLDKDTFEWCIDDSNQGMRKCAQETSRYYDEILNNRYQNIRDELTEEGGKSLKYTQLAWIKYQKCESKIYDKIKEIFEGSMYPTMALQNKARIIQQRAKELDYYYTFMKSN